MSGLGVHWVLWGQAGADCLQRLVTENNSKYLAIYKCQGRRASFWALCSYFIDYATICAGMMTTSSVCTSPSRTWGWRPCTRRGTLTTTSSTSRLGITLKRTKNPSLILPGQKNLCWDLWGSSQGPCLRGAMAWRQVRSQENLKSTFSLALYPVPSLNSPFAGSLTCSRRSTRISFGSHHETNHSLYSVATNVLNLSDPFATSSLSLEASCQYSQLEQTHLSDIKRSDRLRTNLILRYIAETRAGAGVTESQKALTEKATW